MHAPQFRASGHVEERDGLVAPAHGELGACGVHGHSVDAVLALLALHLAHGHVLHRRGAPQRAPRFPVRWAEAASRAVLDGVHVRALVPTTHSEVARFDRPVAGPHKGRAVGGAVLDDVHLGPRVEGVERHAHVEAGHRAQGRVRADACAPNGLCRCPLVQLHGHGLRGLAHGVDAHEARSVVLTAHDHLAPRLVHGAHEAVALGPWQPQHLRARVGAVQRRVLVEAAKGHVLAGRGERDASHARLWAVHVENGSAVRAVQAHHLVARDGELGRVHGEAHAARDSRAVDSAEGFDLPRQNRDAGAVALPEDTPDLRVRRRAHGEGAAYETLRGLRPADAAPRALLLLALQSLRAEHLLGQ
mmetsp:Transcript_14553/g.44363  ORF Transcript_14553/g.44363 Transcript_14553/m.44363 type:complete len:360 (+) Transcript_14553:2725-3804(+)